jgi:O-methyltransferase
MMAVAKTLIRLGHQDRHLYLFDTFEGMSRPTDSDVMRDGQRAQDIWELNRNPDDTNRFCFAPLEEVRGVMRNTGYDNSKIHFIKGKVEDTLPIQAPSTIALLRLDTDWYESTKHELHHLFPRLSRGGVIIFDDYGCWEGAKKAVDEYLKETRTPLLLHRIDAEARIAVKL